MMWWNNGSGWGWPVILAMGVAMVVCMVMMPRMMMRHGRSGNTCPACNRDKGAADPILAKRLRDRSAGVRTPSGRAPANRHPSNRRSRTFCPNGHFNCLNQGLPSPGQPGFP